MPASVSKQEQKCQPMHLKWNKIHWTLSRKTDPRLSFVFQLKHWLAIWCTQNSLIHPHIWCLEFLCATSGRTDKESNRLQPLSATCLFSPYIYHPTPLLSTVASSTLISELCLLTSWNHSTASTHKGGAPHGGNVLLFALWHCYVFYILH